MGGGRVESGEVKGPDGKQMKAQSDKGYASELERLSLLITEANQVAEKLTTLKKEDASEWSCRTCTFINRIAETKCGMCDAVRIKDDLSIRHRRNAIEKNVTSLHQTLQSLEIVPTVGPTSVVSLLPIPLLRVVLCVSIILVVIIGWITPFHWGVAIAHMAQAVLVGIVTVGWMLMSPDLAEFVHFKGKKSMET